jgi:two-component system chemotaxis response regulator CheY
MRMRLRRVVTEAGHDVIEAANGLEAIEMYKEHKPDVVLMDITMPEMDGVEALKQIIELDPNAKVIMCTALGQKSMVMESVKAGAKDFIVKPFQPEQVVEAVNKQVG